MRPETRYKRNILKTWRRVDENDVRDGVNWYPTAHTLAEQIGKGDVKKGAGILAAFSPMVAWSLNVEMARNSVETGHFTGHFRANNAKAERIWNGEEPLRVLGGNKVRAFYQCILTAGECDTPVIDRHSIAVALNAFPSDKERSTYARGRWYDIFAKAYREVAAEIGIPVATLQAVTWVRWRREKGMED
jgi:hypothetical protein